MKLTPRARRELVAQLQTDELNRRTNQLWIGIWIATILVLVSTFIMRRLTGNSISTPSIIIQLTINGLVISNLLLVRTRYARIGQGIFVFALHVAVPLVLIFYGGTRGFGDIAVYTAILLTMLYGWQRWMYLTLGAMGLTLVWVLYLDSTGHPVDPLLDYSAQFTALKFVITGFIMIFALRFISTFYRGLLETYRTFAEEQLRLNEELTASEHALEQLNKNLMQSRQKIVSAREEERRRIRRDLHDGLGPALASQVFRIGVAQRMVKQNPPKAADILVDVESGIHETLANVRELVYGLRPPMLDQLGLLGAMTNFANQQEGRVEIRLDLPTELYHVNAAVEVAVFRIYQTALDNVMKHAEATQCDIRLNVDELSMVLTVSDNGKGINKAQAPGVGLTSMQERAEELDGTLLVLPVQPHGTWLQVSVPLLHEINR